MRNSSKKSRLVRSDEFRFVARLKARLGLYERFGDLFLGYCGSHKVYFLDFKHTNGGIRCPICVKNWLLHVRLDHQLQCVLKGFGIHVTSQKEKKRRQRK